MPPQKRFLRPCRAGGGGVPTSRPDPTTFEGAGREEVEPQVMWVLHTKTFFCVYPSTSSTPGVSDDSSSDESDTSSGVTQNLRHKRRLNVENTIKRRTTCCKNRGIAKGQNTLKTRMDREENTKERKKIKPRALLDSRRVVMPVFIFCVSLLQTNVGWLSALLQSNSFHLEQ